jgi:hypothetical protein
VFSFRFLLADDPAGSLAQWLVRRFQQVGCFLVCANDQKACSWGNLPRQMIGTSVHIPHFMSPSVICLEQVVIKIRGGVLAMRVPECLADGIVFVLQ